MVSSEKVMSAVEAGLKKAQELNVTVTICIVDTAGIEIALFRMNGAFSVSPIFAKAKAVTSGTLGLPTDGIGQYSGEGKPYYGVESLSGGKFSTIAGGLPLKDGDKLIGGVGVGGSTDTNQDKEVAQAVVSAFGG